MNLALNPKTIVWDTFGGLEKPKPEWEEQIAYWEDYAAKFFRSNGMVFSAKDSNVENWLLSDDRAPFADMVKELLPRLEKLVALDDVDAILFAHWLPDIHLGTSVTNMAMHKLGLKDCLGFAISDRGLSAPFFAFDALHKFLSKGRKRGLLIIADQKHTMYKSDVIDAIDPFNAACILPVDLTNLHGPLFVGYARGFITGETTERQVVETLTKGFGLDPQSVQFIGPEDLLDDPVFDGRKTVTDKRLVCAAPFISFSNVNDTSVDHVLLCRDGNCISALGFSGAAS